MKKRTIDVEPTAEDFARVDDGVEHARDRLRYILAKRHAHERMRMAEETNRQRGFFRRIFRLGRA